MHHTNLRIVCLPHSVTVAQLRLHIACAVRTLVVAQAKERLARTVASASAGLSASAAAPQASSGGAPPPPHPRTSSPDRLRRHRRRRPYLPASAAPPPLQHGQLRRHHHRLLLLLRRRVRPAAPSSSGCTRFRPLAARRLRRLYARLRSRPPAAMRPPRRRAAAPTPPLRSYGAPLPARQHRRRAPPPAVRSTRRHTPRRNSTLDAAAATTRSYRFRSPTTSRRRAPAPLLPLARRRRQPRRQQLPRSPWRAAPSAGRPVRSGADCRRSCHGPACDRSGSNAPERNRSGRSDVRAATAVRRALRPPPPAGSEAQPTAHRPSAAPQVPTLAPSLHRRKDAGDCARLAACRAATPHDFRASAASPQGGRTSHRAGRIIIAIRRTAISPSEVDPSLRSATSDLVVGVTPHGGGGGPTAQDITVAARRPLLLRSVRDQAWPRDHLIANTTAVRAGVRRLLRRAAPRDRMPTSLHLDLREAPPELSTDHDGRRLNGSTAIFAGRNPVHPTVRQRMPSTTSTTTSNRSWKFHRSGVDAAVVATASTGRLGNHARVLIGPPRCCRKRRRLCRCPSPRLPGTCEQQFKCGGNRLAGLWEQYLQSRPTCLARSPRVTIRPHHAALTSDRPRCAPPPGTRRRDAGSHKSNGGSDPGHFWFRR